MLTVLACSALLYSAYRVYADLLRQRPIEAAFSASLTLCAEGTLLMLGLGQAGRLRPAPVLAATGALFLLHSVLAFGSQRGKKRPSTRARILPVLFPPLLWPAALALAAVLLWRLYFAWATPPDSWDGLSYHLPIIYRWVRQGDFSLAGWPSFQRYLAPGGDILSAWLALLDGGRMDAAKMGQVLAFPVLFTSGLVLGRRLAGASWAGACALAACAVPVCLIHAGLPYVDLFYGAFFLASAAGALLFDRTGRLDHLTMAVLGFALALGTKSTAYLQAPLLLLPAWTLWKRPDLRRKAVLAGLPLLLLALGVGGSSYLQNWWSTGNPLYPFEFKVAGATVFHGLMAPGDLLVAVEKWFVSSPLHWLGYPFREVFRGSVDYSTENGFGPLFAASWAVLPAAAWLAWKRNNRGVLGVLLLIPATLAAFFALQPAREPRYILFLPGLVIASAAFALSRVRGRAGKAVLAGWSAGIVFACLACAGWFGREPTLRQTWRLLRNRGSISPVEYYRIRFYSLGEAWVSLDDVLKPGDVVAVNYTELMHPWAGLPPRAVVHAVSHRVNPYPGSYFGESHEEWLAMLESLNVRWVGLWTPRWYPEEGEAERASIRRFSRRFKLVGEWDSPEMGKTAVYELLPRDATSRSG